MGICKSKTLSAKNSPTKKRNSHPFIVVNKIKTSDIDDKKSTESYKKNDISKNEIFLPYLSSEKSDKYILKSSNVENPNNVIFSNDMNSTKYVQKSCFDYISLPRKYMLNYFELEPYDLVPVFLTKIDIETPLLENMIIGSQIYLSPEYDIWKCLYNNKECSLHNLKIIEDIEFRKLRFEKLSNLKSDYILEIKTVKEIKTLGIINQKTSLIVITEKYYDSLYNIIEKRQAAKHHYSEEEILCFMQVGLESIKIFNEKGIFPKNLTSNNFVLTSNYNYKFKFLSETVKLKLSRTQTKKYQNLNEKNDNAEKTYFSDIYSFGLIIIDMILLQNEPHNNYKKEILNLLLDDLSRKYPVIVYLLRIIIFSDKLIEPEYLLNMFKNNIKAKIDEQIFLGKKTKKNNIKENELIFQSNFLNNEEKLEKILEFSYKLEILCSLKLFDLGLNVIDDIFKLITQNCNIKSETIMRIIFLKGICLDSIENYQEVIKCYEDCKKIIESIDDQNKEKKEFQIEIYFESAKTCFKMKNFELSRKYLDFIWKLMNLEIQLSPSSFILFYELNALVFSSLQLTNETISTFQITLNYIINLNVDPKEKENFYFFENKFFEISFLLSKEYSKSNDILKNYEILNNLLKKEDFNDNKFSPKLGFILGELLKKNIMLRNIEESENIIERFEIFWDDFQLFLTLQNFHSFINILLNYCEFFYFFVEEKKSNLRKFFKKFLFEKFQEKSFFEKNFKIMCQILYVLCRCFYFLEEYDDCETCLEKILEIFKGPINIENEFKIEIFFWKGLIKIKNSKKINDNLIFQEFFDNLVFFKIEDQLIMNYFLKLEIKIYLFLEEFEKLEEILKNKKINGYIEFDILAGIGLKKLKKNEEINQNYFDEALKCIEKERNIKKDSNRSIQDYFQLKDIAIVDSFEYLLKISILNEILSINFFKLGYILNCIQYLDNSLKSQYQRENQYSNQFESWDITYLQSLCYFQLENYTESLEKMFKTELLSYKAFNLYPLSKINLGRLFFCKNFMVRVNYKLYDFPKAELNLEKLIELMEGKSEYKNEIILQKTNLTSLYIRNGNYVKAKSILVELLKRSENPFNSQTILLRAKIIEINIILGYFEEAENQINDIFIDEINIYNLNIDDIIKAYLFKIKGLFEDFLKNHISSYKNFENSENLYSKYLGDYDNYTLEIKCLKIGQLIKLNKLEEAEEFIKLLEETLKTNKLILLYKIKAELMIEKKKFEIALNIIDEGIKKFKEIWNDEIITIEFADLYMKKYIVSGHMMLFDSKQIYEKSKIFYEKINDKIIHPNLIFLKNQFAKDNIKKLKIMKFSTLIKKLKGFTSEEMNYFFDLLYDWKEQDNIIDNLENIYNSEDQIYNTLRNMLKDKKGKSKNKRMIIWLKPNEIKELENFLRKMQIECNGLFKKYRDHPFLIEFHLLMNTFNLLKDEYYFRTTRT